MGIWIRVGGTVVIRTGQVVDPVLEVLDHGIVSQAAHHGRGIQVGEEHVLGGAVLHHVPVLGCQRVRDIDFNDF